MSTSQTDLIALGKKYLYQNYRQPDLVLTQGSGCKITDAAGREYLDLTGGIAVNSLGHAHPAWVQAISEQSGRLAHTSNYFFNEPNILLAASLCQKTKFARALFCNSGTEAIEASLKLVRRYFFDLGQSKRHRIIAFERSFHGRTLGALAATGQAAYRDGFGPLSVATHVPYADLDAVRAAMGDDVAAILVEPVQGEGGVRPAPAGFIQGLRAIADEAGCLLVADEIQTGIGRTGKFLAFEHAGVQADAVALAKGLGGGFPIGAMLCTEKLQNTLVPGSHGSTFGGNPLASAAALAVLNTLDAGELVARCAKLGEFLAGLLQELVRKNTTTTVEARGLGLLQAIELKPELDLRTVLGDLRDAGLLLTAAGGSALRFTPPLTVSESELELGVEILSKVLGQIQ